MIAIPKQQYKIEFLFPIGVVTFSIINAINQIFYSNDISYLSITVSIIGIAGGLLYFGKDKLFPILIFIWSAAQVLIIQSTKINPTTNESVNTSLLDLSQTVKFDVGFSFSGTYGSTWIAINIVGIVFLGLTKILSLSLLFDKEISIIPFRENSSLDEFLPSTGTIENRITLSKEKNWLLVKMNAKEGHASSITFALIKPKDDSNLKLKNGQIVYFLVVPDRNMIKEENNLRDDFVNGDWAIVN